MQQRYNVGDRVSMTSDALDNYGVKYEDKEFEIVTVSKSATDHPGFDGSAGCVLYDFKGLTFSLYDYELK